MKDFENEQKLKEEIKMGIENEIELNHLKKINRNITFLHTIIFLMLFIILSIFLVLFIKYYKANSIINEAYQNLQSLSQANNYKLVRDSININYQTSEISQEQLTYYYKDGRYKLTSNITDNAKFKNEYSTTKYFEDNGYSSTIIFHNLKSIEKITNSYIELKKGDPFRIFSDTYMYGSINGFSSIYLKLSLSIRTDYFNEEECYVIRAQSSEDGYRETWISKENFFTIRQVETVNNLYYKEEKFNLMLDVVNDEDVDSSNILQMYNDYTITDNITIDNYMSYYNVEKDND